MSDARNIDATVRFSIVPEAVADHSISGLSANAVRLYAILDRYGNSEGAVATPSRATLARRCGFSVDTVDRAKRELVEAGFLEVVNRRHDDGDHDTNEYRLHREGVAARMRPPGRTDAGTGSRIRAAQQRTTLTETSPSNDGEGDAVAPRSRDEIWDFLEEKFGSVGTDRRAQAHQKRNKAVADLRRLGATPDGIRYAIERWPYKFAGATLTDIALATHYPQLTADRGETVTVAAEPLPPATVLRDRASGLARGLRQGVCAECGIGGGNHTTDCSLARETPRRAYDHFIRETAANGAYPLDEIGFVIDSWRDLDDMERQHYRDLAEEIRANHKQEAA